MPAADAAGYNVNPSISSRCGHTATTRSSRSADGARPQPRQLLRRGRAGRLRPGPLRAGHRGRPPDKMLQGRLFAYGDAHRYRLGINHNPASINRPHATEADNYGRDGSMRFDAHYGREKNYEPNSFGGPAESGEPLYGSLAGGPSARTRGTNMTVTTSRRPAPFTDSCPRGQGPPRRQHRLGARSVSKDDIVERSIANFRHADPTTALASRWLSRHTAVEQVH